MHDTHTTRRPAGLIDHDCDELGAVEVAAYVHDPVNGDDPYIVVDVNAETPIKVTLNDGTVFGPRDPNVASPVQSALINARRALNADPADFDHNIDEQADDLRLALDELVAALDADA